MLTLISQRVVDLGFRKGDALEQSYSSYFSKLGFTLLPVPNKIENLDTYFGLPVKRVILTGGGDINPELYGEKITDEDVSKERDDTERQLLEYAIKNQIPVLGVCRGMQFINVYFGGKIKKIDRTKHVNTTHGVTIDNRVFPVNSFHGYGITRGLLSPKLKVFAVSEDEVIEGIYHTTLPIVGIEWHPERDSPNTEVNDNIVSDFYDKKGYFKK